MSVPRSPNSTHQKDEISRLHKKLLFTTLAIDYLHETVDNGLQKSRFVAACKEHFHTEIEDSMEDVEGILQHLERKGHIGIGNYDILKDIVKFNVKIVDEIKKTEVAMRKGGGTVISQTEDGRDSYLIAEVENKTANAEEWHAASVDIKKIQIDLQSHHIKLASQNSHHFEWFSRNLQTHLELMRESNTILRLCQADAKDERIQNFVELANTSKEKLISHDDAFHEFSTRWRTLNRLLIENCKLIAFLQEKGAEFEGFIQSSLYVFLSFRSLEMLDSFWNDYKSGSLNREVQNALFTDRLENENQTFRLTLSEENYQRYRKYLEDQLRKETEKPDRELMEFEEPTSTTNEETSMERASTVSRRKHKATASQAQSSTETSTGAKRKRKPEQRGKSDGNQTKVKQTSDDQTAGSSSSGTHHHRYTLRSSGPIPDIRTSEYKNEKQKHIKSVEQEIRIVLLGKTGAGKSSTGNLLLGKRVFQAGFSPMSVSKQCNRQEVHTNKTKYVIIDTPGFFDTREIDKDILNAEITRCISLTSPGPHVLLYIQAPSRCTEEEERSIRDFLKVFGEDACKYMILVYVRKDEFEQSNVSFKDYLQMLPKFWTNFITMCDGRVLCINNNNITTDADLLRSAIDNLVSKNKGNYFSHNVPAENLKLRDEDREKSASDCESGTQKSEKCTSNKMEDKSDKELHNLNKKLGYQEDEEKELLREELSLKQQQLKQMQVKHEEALRKRKEYEDKLKAQASFESERRRLEAQYRELQAKLEAERVSINEYRRRKRRDRCSIM